MPYRSRCRRPTRPEPPEPPYRDPPVHRWPHPIECSCKPPAEDPTFHYIRCALSYQNQILAEIKSLLETIVEKDSGTADS